MVKLTNTDKVYRFVMEKNEKIKIRDVYNRIFFSSFGLDGVRIYNKSEQKQDTIEDKSEIVSQKIDTHDADKNIEDLFGKEQKPSGYSELPLYKTSVEHNDGTVTEDVEETTGVYEFLNDYILKYSKTDESIDVKINEVAITFPRDINNPIITLQEIVISDKHHRSAISKTGITYEILEKIIRDIHLQIEHLKGLGYFYNEIPLETTFLINGRYIILSIETIDVLNKTTQGAQPEIKDAFLKFLQNLLDDDIKNILDKIQYTDLYYFIKRVQDENVFFIL